MVWVLSLILEAHHSIKCLKMTVAGNWCYISKTAFNELWTHDIRNGQNLIKAPHFIYFCYLMSSIFMSHPSLPSSVQTMRRSL